jgi:hypothetical protein
MLVEELLEGHLAVQLGVERHEGGAESAAAMRAQDAEPLAVGCGPADGVNGRVSCTSCVGRRGARFPTSGDCGRATAGSV